MPTASGHITAVEEARFRLLTDDGHTLLLTLSRHAPLSGQDLCQLQQANSHVHVEYEGSPNLTSAIAHVVTESKLAGPP
jgi:hypothetical protein